MIRAPVLLASLFVVLSALVPKESAAHGTGWRLTDERAVVVELYYADGEQMPFADATVFSPADADVPVLHGRADARGRVAFVPDRGGVWTVSATDGDGHGIRAPIPVSLESASVGAAAVPSAQPSARLRLALILSILLNVGLLLGAWRMVSRFQSR